MMKQWKKRFGAHLTKDEGTHFSLWAPRYTDVQLTLLSEKNESFAMSRSDEGIFILHLPQLTYEVDYLYQLCSGVRLPDPASSQQPYGVMGASRTLDTSSWKSEPWPGIPLADYLLYELHIGTFTREGTFDAAIEKLPHLVQLGITAVEVMPLASFSGERNWGYDGVFPYAPQHSYGGAHAFRRFIEACHNSGLAVVLDVVYNHFGPEGSVFDRLAPYFTDRYATPWGKAINYDGEMSEQVRRYIIDNALYWLCEYQVDALRLDAIHGIFDASPKHILRELHENFTSCAKQLGKKAYLIAESDLNDVKVITPTQAGGYGIDAQWNDEYHHALYASIAGERRGYFADFGSLKHLAKAIGEGFVNDGCWSTYRRRHFGTSSAAFSGEHFVLFTENHDQIANARAAEPLAAKLGSDKAKLAAALLLFSPGLPLLFMGQEWGCTQPFFYFTSFTDPELAKAVREGRVEEYRDHYAEGAFPDPQDAETFNKSKLDWSLCDGELLALYRQLILLRKKWPQMREFSRKYTRVEIDSTRDLLKIYRSSPSETLQLLLCANMGEREEELPATLGPHLLSTSGKSHNLHLLPAWSAAIYQVNQRAMHEKREEEDRSKGHLQGAAEQQVHT